MDLKAEAQRVVGEMFANDVEPGKLERLRNQLRLILELHEATKDPKKADIGAPTPALMDNAPRLIVRGELGAANA